MIPSDPFPSLLHKLYCSQPTIVPRLKCILYCQIQHVTKLYLIGASFKPGSWHYANFTCVSVHMCIHVMYIRMCTWMCTLFCVCLCVYYEIRPFILAPHNYVHVNTCTLMRTGGHFNTDHNTHKVATCII